MNDSSKLYIMDKYRKKEKIVPSHPFTDYILTINLIDDNLALVRDTSYMYVVDANKKRAFRLFESPYKSYDSPS